MAKDLQELGILIREQRIEKGLTQAELAERLKIRRPTISEIENGHESKTSTVLKIFKELNISTIKERL